MQVAGSASREHKHDSHNTEKFNNNFVDVVSGANWREG